MVSWYLEIIESTQRNNDTYVLSYNQGKQILNKHYFRYNQFETKWLKDVKNKPIYCFSRKHPRSLKKLQFFYLA